MEGDTYEVRDNSKLIQLLWCYVIQKMYQSSGEEKLDSYNEVIKLLEPCYPLGNGHTSAELSIIEYLFRFNEHFDLIQIEKMLKNSSIPLLIKAFSQDFIAKYTGEANPYDIRNLIVIARKKFGDDGISKIIEILHEIKNADGKNFFHVLLKNEEFSYQKGYFLDQCEPTEIFKILTLNFGVSNVLTIAQIVCDEKFVPLPYYPGKYRNFVEYIRERLDDSFKDLLEVLVKTLGNDGKNVFQVILETKEFAGVRKEFFNQFTDEERELITQSMNQSRARLYDVAIKNLYEEKNKSKLTVETIKKANYRD